MLYRVVQDHVETFLAARDGPSSPGLPRFIRREFLSFLDCGVPARGFCPSCCHRRMLDHEAHITEAVLPDLPIRQFVFTFPFALRYRMAFDPALCADVRRVVMRALFAFYRDRAEKKNLPTGPTGAICVGQRFGSALNLNCHFHIIAFDGVFVRSASPSDDARHDFHFTGSPTRSEIERLLHDCIRRVERLLNKRGIDPGHHAADDPADEQPELAACLRQAVLDRERRHRRNPRRARQRHAKGHALVAHDRGYSIHADTAIPGFDSTRRSMLVRYILRPPFAPSQVELSDDGKVSFRLPHPFDDGTTHILWTKDAFLARLAALVPRPRKHLITYHGVLAPAHALRPGVVRAPPSSTGSGRKRRAAPRKRSSHEQLLLRAYGFLFRRCDRCGGDKRVLAVINSKDVIDKILRALGLDPDPPQRAPPRVEWHVA